MHRKLICFLLFLLFGAFLSNVNAQSGYGYSYIEAYQPNPSSEKRVYAESGTVLDYQFWYYYDPGAQATLL